MNNKRWEQSRFKFQQCMYFDHITECNVIFGDKWCWPAQDQQGTQDFHCCRVTTADLFRTHYVNKIKPTILFHTITQVGTFVAFLIMVIIIGCISTDRNNWKCLTEVFMGTWLAYEFWAGLRFFGAVGFSSYSRPDLTIGWPHAMDKCSRIEVLALDDPFYLLTSGFHNGKWP
jgi:hypothetical protein